MYGVRPAGERSYCRISKKPVEKERARDDAGDLVEHAARDTTFATALSGCKDQRMVCEEVLRELRENRKKMDEGQKKNWREELNVTLKNIMSKL
jgi:hypothetical protein